MPYFSVKLQMLSGRQTPHQECTKRAKLLNAALTRLAAYQPDALIAMSRPSLEAELLTLKPHSPAITVYCCAVQLQHQQLFASYASAAEYKELWEL